VVAADKARALHVRPIVQRFEQGEAEVITLGLRDGTALRVTPDHRILTDRGWKEAGELTVGDRVARPRQWLDFGHDRPITPDEARLLGYLIGDGCVTGKTPISFINVQETLHADAARIASDLGCDAYAKGIQVYYSHRPGEKNGVLELVRWAGVWGKAAPEKSLPHMFFSAEIAEDLAANLVFGLFESDGHVTREQSGAIRLGYTTTSEQLAHQLHWLLLRWGIGSSVRRCDPKKKRPSIIKGRRVQGKLPIWELRISGMENVERFAEVIPTWGPRSSALVEALADPALLKHRGSQRNYLSRDLIEPVVSYLDGRGITARWVAALVGDSAGDPRGGIRQVLGYSRLRRDRVQLLADALESPFLDDVLAEEVWYDKVMSVSEPEWADVYDVEVDEHHTFVANDVVISNCSPPFKQAEFDIVYGKGISREGSLLDMAVDMGIVKKSGAWFTYEGEQLGQGREKAKEFLMSTPEITVEISDKVMAQAGLSGTAKDDPDVDVDVEGDVEVEGDDVFTAADDEPIA